MALGTQGKRENARREVFPPKNTWKSNSCRNSRFYTFVSTIQKHLPISYLNLQRLPCAKPHAQAKTV